MSQSTENTSSAEQLVNTGNTFFELGEYQKALASYKQALTLDPKNAQLHANAGATFFQLERYPESLEAHKQALEIDPNNAEYHSNVGETLYELKQYPESLEAHKQALEIDPNNAEYHANVGDALFELKQYPEALISFKEASALDPENAQHHTNVGSTLFQLDQYQEALEAHKQALAIDQNNAEYHANVGSTLFQLGQYPEALEAHKRALEIDLENAEYHTNVGSILFQLGQYPEALEAHKQALAIDQNNAEYHTNAGGALFQLGQYPEALEAHKRALEIDPNNAEYHTNAGNTLFRMREYTQALEAYKQALAIDPQNAQLYTNIGTTLYKLSRDQESLEAHKQASALDRENAEHHANVGDTLFRMEEYTHALEAYKQALAIDQKNAQLHANAGNTLYELKQYPEALKSFIEALAIDPKNAQLHSNVGNVLFKLGQYQKTLEAYKQAAAIDPKNAEHHDNAGNTLFRMKEYPQALEAYKKALAIDQKNAQLHANVGTTLCELGQHQESLEAYKQAAALDQANAQHHTNVGDTLYELKQYPEALESHKQALAIDPENAEHHTNVGNVLFTLCQYPEALESYKQALAIDPKNAQHHTNVGNTLYELEQYSKALKSFIEALATDPENAQLHTNVGETLFRMEEYPRALESYKQAIAIDQENAHLHARTGTTFFKLGQYPQALESYKQAVKLDPQNATHNSNLGVALSALDQHQEALEYFKKAMELEPENHERIFQMATLLFEMKKYIEATLFFYNALYILNDTNVTKVNDPLKHNYSTHTKTALKCLISSHYSEDQCNAAVESYLQLANPNLEDSSVKDELASNFTSIAYALFNNTQYAEALPYGRIAVKLEPDNQIHKQILGKALNAFVINKDICTMNDLEIATQYCHEAMDLNPGDAGYKLGMAFVLNISGRQEESLAMYREVFATTPESTSIKSCIIDLLTLLKNNAVRNKQDEKALEFGIELITMQPKNADHHNNCGMMSFALNRNEKALEYFQKASELDPTNIQYIEMTQLILQMQAREAFNQNNYTSAITICSKILLPQESKSQSKSRSKQNLKHKDEPVVGFNRDSINILGCSFVELSNQKASTNLSLKQFGPLVNTLVNHGDIQFLESAISLLETAFGAIPALKDYRTSLKKLKANAKSKSIEPATPKPEDKLAPDESSDSASVKSISPVQAVITPSLDAARASSSNSERSESPEDVATQPAPQSPETTKKDEVKNLINAAKATTTPKNAIEAWQKTISEEPNNPTFHNNLGNAYFNNGQIDEAATEFKIATEMNSKHPLYHNNLAAAFYEQGNKDEALQEYAAAIELAQKADQVKFHEDYADLLLELRPNSNAALCVAFMEYTKAGNSQNAETLKKRIIEKKIKYLDLTDYKLNDMDLEILESLLLQTQDLTNLNLGQNTFQDGHVEKLSADLMAPTAITKIMCSGKSVALLREKAEDATILFRTTFNADALMDILQQSPELIDAMRDEIISPQDLKTMLSNQDSKITPHTLRDIKNKLIFKATLSSYNKESKSFAPEYQDILNNNLYDFDLIEPMKEAMSDGALAPTALVLLLNYIAPSEYKEISNICPKGSSYAQKYFYVLAFRSENYKTNEVVAQKFLAALYDAIDPSNKIHILEQLETSQLHNIIEMLNPTEDSVSLYYLAKAYLGLGKYEAAKTICGDLLSSNDASKEKVTTTKSKVLTPPKARKSPVKEKAVEAQKYEEDILAKNTVTFSIDTSTELEVTIVNSSQKLSELRIKSSLKAPKASADTKQTEISIDEFRALLNEITTKHTEYQKNSAIAADLITGVTKRPTTPPDTKHKVTKAEDANFDDEARANTPPQEAIIKWKINSIDYSYEPNCKTIVKVEGLINCYAAMTRESYNEITTPAEKDQFKTAIQQVVSGKVAKNGMKQLDTKCYEVKINGDNRLFCNKAYVVEGKYKLFIFDKYTDHRGIETLAKNSLIEQNAGTNDNAIYQDGLELADILGTEAPFLGEIS